METIWHSRFRVHPSVPFLIGLVGLFIVFFALTLFCQRTTLAQTIKPSDTRLPQNRTESQSTSTTNHPARRANRTPKFDSVIVNAFKASHQGYSSDEVILNDQLNESFLLACKKQLAQTELPKATAYDLNWRLMNLRKAGKLNVKATRSNRASVLQVTHVAEIAARTMHDKYSISSDHVMANPLHRSEFNAIIASLNPDVDLYSARKAAFQLRKARRLRPELITRIADWGRVVKTYPAKQVAADPDRIAAHPGIYIFRDATGYLYIGQSDDLRSRLKSHLDQSHNQSLANYLGEKNLEQITIEVHSFDPDSQAKKTMVRRAYESELIASRKPKFNIQP